MGTELVYSDPPYRHSTRKAARRYRHDYDEGDHAALLASLPCAVMDLTGESMRKKHAVIDST